MVIQLRKHNELVRGIPAGFTGLEGIPGNATILM